MGRMTGSRFGWVALLVAALVTLAACGSGDQGGTDKDTTGVDTQASPETAADMAAPDTGTPDTTTDTGTPDATTDTGTPDATTDTGTPDTATDTGTPDTATDTGTPDTAADTGTPDATADTGTPDSAADAGGPPASHTDDQQGVRHGVGKQDPLQNCVACHGAALKGDVGPSCYTCHNNDDHTKSHGGKKHKSGTSTSCNACHGPNNTGGLGPRCKSCHPWGGN